MGPRSDSRVAEVLLDRYGHLTVRTREAGINMLETGLARMIRAARWVMFGVVAGTLAACAAATVAPQANSLPLSPNRPTTVYVYPFAVTDQDVTLNQGFLSKTYRNMTSSGMGDQGQQQLAEETAQDLAGAMVSE